jgi:hypothetical protein
MAEEKREIEDLAPPVKVRPVATVRPFVPSNLEDLIAKYRIEERDEAMAARFFTCLHCQEFPEDDDLCYCEVERLRIRLNNIDVRWCCKYAKEFCDEVCGQYDYID